MYIIKNIKRRIRGKIIATIIRKYISFISPASVIKKQSIEFYIILKGFPIILNIEEMSVGKGRPNYMRQPSIYR